MIGITACDTKKASFAKAKLVGVFGGAAGGVTAIKKKTEDLSRSLCSNRFCKFHSGIWLGVSIIQKNHFLLLETTSG
jgi:hypothetical protein